MPVSSMLADMQMETSTAPLPVASICMSSQRNKCQTAHIGTAARQLGHRQQLVEKLAHQRNSNRLSSCRISSDRIDRI